MNRPKMTKVRKKKKTWRRVKRKTKMGSWKKMKRMMERCQMRLNLMMMIAQHPMKMPTEVE